MRLDFEVHRQTRRKYPKVNLEALTLAKKFSVLKLPVNERELQEIHILDLDIEIIKKQCISAKMQEDLVKRNLMARGNPQLPLTFYTDGSVRKINSSTQDELTKMGVG